MKQPAEYEIRLNGFTLKKTDKKRDLNVVIHYSKKTL